MIRSAVSYSCSEGEKQDKTFECILKLVPIVATFAKDPIIGAANLFVWLASCLPKLGSPPAVGGRKRRRALRAAYDFGGADWVIHTSGKISQ
jgi:hypothetical protein